MRGGGIPLFGKKKEGGMPPVCYNEGGEGTPCYPVIVRCFFKNIKTEALCEIPDYSKGTRGVTPTPGPEGGGGIPPLERKEGGGVGPLFAVMKGGRVPPCHPVIVCSFLGIFRRRLCAKYRIIARERGGLPPPRVLRGEGVSPHLREKREGGYAPCLL